MRTEYWWRSEVEPFIWHRVEPVFIGSHSVDSVQGLHEAQIEMPGEMVWRQACRYDEHWPEGEAPDGICSKPDRSRLVCPWCLLPEGVNPLHAQAAARSFAHDHDDVDFADMGVFLMMATLCPLPKW